MTSHNFTTKVIVKKISNKKGKQLWYQQSSDWLLGMYGVVSCIYEWLFGFLSFQSVFVDFHWCHSQLASFSFITSFFVSYYLTTVIPNMMLYSINSDTVVVQRPYPANYCYIYTLLCLLFFFSFCLCYSSFSYTNSFIHLVLLFLLPFWYGLELGLPLLFAEIYGSWMYDTF